MAILIFVINPLTFTILLEIKTHQVFYLKKEIGWISLLKVDLLTCLELKKLLQFKISDYEANVRAKILDF